MECLAHIRSSINDDGSGNNGGGDYVVLYTQLLSCFLIPLGISK